MAQNTDPYDQPMERGEAAGMPVIPNGTYESEIVEVTSPEESTFNPGTDAFRVVYRLLDDELEPETDLFKFVNVTAGMLRGKVDPKAAYYDVLESAGYDMDGPLPSIRKAQTELVGKRAMLTVKNGPPRNDPSGESRPRIAAMLAVRKPKRQPVAAVVAGAKRSKPTDWAEDDE